MRIVLASLLILMLACPLRAGDDWAGFRGPRGDGCSMSVGLPVTFGETENLVWKTPIHDKGWSSPVVWGDQIWLTTATKEGHTLYAVCVDLETGAIRHDIKVFDVAEPQYCHPTNSYASCTPAIEAGRVYVHYGAHGTAAIDTTTGKIVWTREDLPCDHFRGPASSPIIVDDLLILTFDGFDLHYVAALDKHTGRTVWRTDRNIDYGTDDGDMMKAYSTPQVIATAGGRQMISPSAGATIAYDPATGRELWRVRSGGVNASCRAMFGHGLVFCTSGSSGGWQLFAVRPDGAGDVTGTHLQWKSSKGVPTRSTPLLLGELLFMVSDQGVLTCLEAETGDLVWQERYGGRYWASPVYADGKLYFFSESGAAPVVAAGREYKLLAENKLEAGCMASPAIADRSLLVRTKTHLYRFEKTP